MADSMYDQAPAPLARTLSTGSIDSVVPPPLKHKKRVTSLFIVLVITTLGMLVVTCLYADIAGQAAYYYTKPDSWQFCIIYADSTTQLWDKKLVDGTATMLSYLGLMALFYTWAALAATFRALFHYEWIPSTIVFLLFDIFGQLAYYQSSNLVTVPGKLPLTLLVATKWVKMDMYNKIGKFCTDSYYFFIIKEGHLLPKTYPNCTDSVIIIDDKVQNSDSQITQINLMTNGTVLNEDLNCDGALALNIIFLVLAYSFVFITFALIIVLILADREIRMKRPQRHFFKESGKDLKYDKWCLLLCFLGALGYVMTSVANLDAGFTALHFAHDYHLVDSDVEIAQHVSLGNVVLDLDLDFYINSYLPFKMNQLDLQTVLLIITCMSCVRGHFKQSISAFRLGAVTSLLACLIQWPAVVGNMETFSYNDLWWWSDYDKCVDFHTGLPFLNADRNGSRAFCNDTRWGMAGALITFVALHINIIACATVYAQNQNRESLIIADVPGLGDPFSFNYDTEFRQSDHHDKPQSHSSNKEPKQSTTTSLA
eukprot:CAMPEP_0114344230 /NCGR_PEP_ID=MMETSP0101-20121206/11256_1 /TAXON_ID=38822 ORGANISM="Pteridomonas danica, Strain PT" /NCGR_SAMPLE_ID=MMETSP0101 /ASSEMBLY_ACC=CAM_ASM_000211 /LENGTH=538 /DNA_ID=CAMNT_0001479459 /DNA_START=55 /DNA_END=1671 /DNA_ORIENTATION=-